MNRIEPDSPLIAAAKQYRSPSGRKSHSVRSNCRAFDQIMGKLSVEAITLDTLQEFIAISTANETKGKRQISGIVSDVKAVVYFVTGTQLVQPDSPLVAAAVSFQIYKAGKNRNAKANCRAFDQIIGKIPVESITLDTLQKFIAISTENETKGKREISRIVSDVKAVVCFATGKRLVQPTEPDSPLIAAAKTYQSESGRENRNAQSSCRVFDQTVGQLPVESITLNVVQKFIKKAAATDKRAVARIVSDVKAVVHFATGTRLVKPNEPKPKKRRKRRKAVVTVRRSDPQPILKSEDPSQALICHWSREYCDAAGVVRREPIYSANRFAKLVGNLRVSMITTESLCEFRKESQDKGLSPATIETSISDIITLVNSAIDVRLKPGKRLRKPRPVPKPVTLVALEETWNNSAPWLQQWVVLSFWTGLRLSDVLRMQISLTNTVPEVLSWQASKTQHHFQWPIVPWLNGYLTRRELPFQKAACFAKRVVRLAIREACLPSGTKIWTPKNMRQFSLNSWMKTSPAAGQIIHGCGLNGVLKHYIDPMVILEEAAGKIQVPEFFIPPDQRESLVMDSDDPFKILNQLDPNSRRILLQTMRAMLGAG